MTAGVISFGQQPAEFEWLDGEPAFDPDAHLRLELPASTRMLAEFGYSADEIALTATPVAATSAFRVLSDDGAAVLLDIGRRLAPFAAPNPRIERTVRSGCHRSRWLRDFCLSPDVTEHLCKVFAADVAPHPITSQVGHLNYAPAELGRPVDKWHHDTLALDYVMMVADPTLLDGGDFEYFVGTKHEAAQFAAAGTQPPPERCVAVDWPGAGFAVALHGNMVVHRGGPLHSAGERISMVNGYVATDVGVDDQTRNRDLLHVDDARVLARDWARYAAWRARQRLDLLIDHLADPLDPDAAASQLAAAVEDVTRAISDLRADGLAEPHHYETR